MKKKKHTQGVFKVPIHLGNDKEFRNDDTCFLNFAGKLFRLVCRRVPYGMVYQMILFLKGLVKRILSHLIATNGTESTECPRRKWTWATSSLILCYTSDLSVNLKYIVSAVVRLMLFFVIIHDFLSSAVGAADLKMLKKNAQCIIL